MQGYGTYEGLVNFFVFCFSWSLHVQTIASGLNGQEIKNERNKGKTNIISAYIHTASAQMGS
jgi:hypothetical protein